MNHPAHLIAVPMEEDKVLIDDIWQSTKTGRPCGDNRFIIKMESHLEGNWMHCQREELRR